MGRVPPSGQGRVDRIWKWGEPRSPPPTFQLTGTVFTKYINFVGEGRIEVIVCCPPSYRLLPSIIASLLFKILCNISFGRGVSERDVPPQT